MTSLHAIVRRSAEHPSVANFVKRATYEGSGDDLPAAGMFFIAATFFVVVVGLSLFEYTLKDVVATLAMVETPAAAITVSPSSEEDAPKDVKEGLLETGPTITLVHQKPVTSSIRATIRHLVSVGGRWSRFRGIKLHALHSLLFFFVSTVVEVVVPPVPGKMVIVPALSGALCANVHATWIHKVVSVPSDKTFRERLVPFMANWKVLALPAAVQASAAYLSLYIGYGLVVLLGLAGVGNDNFANYNGKEWTSLLLRTFAIVIVILSCALFIVLPAQVTLIRVEASLLPEDDDTIVPFDRSFGGKVVPKVLGGTGAIGFVDAWKSFNWEARRRLIKLYVKIFAIMTFLIIAVAHVIALMIIVIVPAKSLKQMMAHGSGNRDNFF